METASALVTTDTNLKLKRLLSLWGLPQHLSYEYVQEGSPTDEALSFILGFKPKGDKVVIPYHNPFTGTTMEFTREGQVYPYVRARLLDPYVNPKDKKIMKYASSTDSGTHIYFTPLISDDEWRIAAIERYIPLVFVEGEKKADYLAQFYPAILPIGISGVWQWMLDKDDAKKMRLRTLVKTHLPQDFSFVNPTNDSANYLFVFIQRLIKESSKNSKLAAFPFKERLKPYIDSCLEIFKGNSPVLPPLQEIMDREKVYVPANCVDKFSKIQIEIEKALTSDITQYQFHSEISDNFKLNNRKILIGFDNDYELTKPLNAASHSLAPINHAAEELAKTISNAGGVPIMVLIPKSKEGHPKMGIDDFGNIYAPQAVRDLLVLAMTNIRDLTLVVNPDRPRSFNNEENEDYKVINPAGWNKSATSILIGKILLHRDKIAYKQSVGWFKFNGLYWDYLGNSKTATVIKAVQEARENQSDFHHSYTMSEVEASALVPDELWNLSEAQGDVLLANGVYNHLTRVFTPLEALGDTSNRFFTSQVNTPYIKPTVEELMRFHNFMNHYTEGSVTELRYLIAMAAWLMYPKHVFINAKDKFPVEKMFYLVGRQGTGKSTFLEFLVNTIAPSNVVTITPSNLATPEGLGNYMRANLWKSTDFSGSITKDAVETLNKVISGESVEARVLYSQSVNLVIPTGVMLAGNDTLSFPAQGTAGILRRLVYIPFNKRISKPSHEVIKYASSQEARSVFLFLILQLSIEEITLILNSGQYFPDKYKQFNSSTQDSNDKLGDFHSTYLAQVTSTNTALDEFCKKFKAKEVFYRTDLFELYQHYCKESGIVHQLTAHTLEKLLRENNYILPHLTEEGEIKKYQNRIQYKVNLEIESAIDASRLVSNDLEKTSIALDKYLNPKNLLEIS
jgi:phage/plasmid-associated DNA primase